MKKLVVLGILTLVGALLAAPASYDVKRLHSSVTVTVDGTLGELDDSYLIDTLNSQDNCYAWDTGTPWAPADFQYQLFMAHDDSKVYVALKTVRDDVADIGTSTGCSDAYKVNPGGQAMAFYFFFGGNVNVNPSCPYTQGSTLFTAMNTAGNGANLPTVEFTLAKDVIDPFGMGTFQLSIGFEEGDLQSCMNTIYGAIGAEYTGFKQDWSSNPWDNPLYYPTFNLTEIDAAESNVAVKNVETLSASPNPFMPATTLNFNVKNNGSLKIYDVAGKTVYSTAVKSGAGQVNWNARDLASGIYVARLISGKNVLNTRLFLTR